MINILSDSTVNHTAKNLNKIYANKENTSNYYKIILKNPIQKLMSQNKNNFSVLHMNIKSLNKNFPEIENMLIELNEYPDVIALTEIKIKESGTQVNRVLNYFTVHNDTKTSPGGLGIYIKSNICFKLRQDLEIKCREYESIGIEIVQNGKINIIGVICKHPNYNFQEFQNNFLNTLDNLNEIRCKFYIC